MTAPWYVAYAVMATSVVMIAATIIGLGRALAAAGWAADKRARVVSVTALLLIGWFGLTVLLARMGVFDGASDRVPTIQFGFLIPIAVGGLLMWRSRTVSAIVDAVPQHWLIGLHVFRAVGVIFFVLYVAGRIPGLFAIPAAIGDAAVTLLAPFVAYAAARDPSGSTGRVAAWNVLGIVDFLVAFATGVLTGPSPVQVTAFDNPSTLVTAYPLVLIPVYLVPLWTLLHIASLLKLRRAVVEASSRPGTGTA